MRALLAVEGELALAGVGRGAQAIIARVIKLMVSAGVDGGTPFTIVKA